jgi:hypothetical protein
MYEPSSVAGYRTLCRRDRVNPGRCSKLRQSGLTAANSLVGLAKTNAVAGMIPTRSTGCTGCDDPDEADTIIDSMMNVPLLLWAYRETQRPEYRQVARRHAQQVARFLVRPDGSTAQSVHVRRSDGRFLFVHTHQGFSDASTWARGQAWAIYGFAETGSALHDPALVTASERAARYVAGHLPATGLPPYDYSAPAGAPVDTSAGVITAAGLMHLAEACSRLRGACATPDAWEPLARRMLRASLQLASPNPPLGFLGSQVFTLGRSSAWDDNGEFIFGLNYALEAADLTRG